MSSRIRSDEELKEYWNEFSQPFSNYIQQTTTATAFSLMTFLKLQLDEKQNVLEIGCGGGGAISIANAFRGKNTSYTALDISPQMLEIAKKNFELSNAVLHKEPINFVNASASSLPFENSTFDKVIGNYLLHIVPDPDIVLQETRRVLKKGGICAFTVWGRKENCPRFTLSPPIVSKFVTEWKLDYKEDNVRSGFYLSDLNDLRNRVLKAGFSHCIAWYSLEILDVTAGEQFANGMIFGSVQLQKFFQNLNEEQKRIFHKAISDAADSILKEGKPICNEVAVVIGFV